MRSIIESLLRQPITIAVGTMLAVFSGILAITRVPVRMTPEVWARHANPWSGWTRVAILPLFVLAIWSRAWLGWWALVPLALLVVAGMPANLILKVLHRFGKGI